jgi:hypothetical protein
MDTAGAAVESLILRKTHRVIVPPDPVGDGAAAARQFDAVLMQAGFKASRRLLERLAGLTAGTVIDLALRVLPVVREMAGDHVQHNTYFRDFPAGVPDTVEHWLGCLREALLDPVAAGSVEAAVTPAGVAFVNLLTLPSYGTYQHSFAEMVAAHDELIPKASDRVTVLTDGAGLMHDALRLYNELAVSPVPLAEHDLEALRLLARFCLVCAQPAGVPVRESRAVINEVRLAAGHSLIAMDTVTDVLRLAVAVSAGDVSLREPARFRSFTRPERAALLGTLEAIVAGNAARLGDVPRYGERWKRLGERIHPGDFPEYPDAAEVFKIARGDRRGVR